MTTLTLVPRSAASDRSSYERAFAALEAAGCRPRARGESGLDACCPSHDDTDASLSGDWKAGTAERSGAMMLKCHAASGCTFDTILEALGLRRADMFDGLSPEYAAKRGTATPSPRRAPRPRKAAPARPRRTSEPKPKADHEHDYKHERTHIYADAHGTIVARIHRKRCTVDGCNEKTFRTGYPNGKPADGVPLYGTPELAAAIADGRTIHICEGEGDQEALTAAGEIAVSAPFGADTGEGDKWLPMHTEQLRGARAVVIWADRDAAGLLHAGYIANQLLTSGGVLHAEPTPTGTGVTIDLRIVYPAVETPKADASDHLTAGFAVADAVDVPAEDLASTGLTGPATAAVPTPQETQPPAADPVQEPADPETDTQEADAEEADRDESEPGQAPPPGFAVEGSSGWRYSTTAGRDGTMWKSSGRGDTRTWGRELSWAPILEERLVLMKDDGKPGAKYFTFRVGADTATVSLADLRTGDAWEAFPDAIGTGSKPVREALLNCIETQGKKMPRIPVVTRTGWHTLPDVGRTYVFADGRTFPEGRYVQVIGAPEPLRRAAEPLKRTADDAECRTAIGSIAAHGWAAFMGLGAGARSLGYTLRPVPSSLVFDAEPNSGKTQAGNTGRSLVLTPRPNTWPPVVTKGMNSTITDIECAIDFEGDTPSLLDDVALTRASPAIEVREMEKKLELVLRAGGNLTEIRGRRNRDLTAKPGNYIRSIPVVAAQMLPISMQESLYRRSVVIYLSREGGEVDWRWYRDGGGAALSVPLRTLGDRIIAHLHGIEDPDAYLADLETRALKRFGPYIEAELPESSGTMDGVVTSAAAMLAGFGLLAAVTGLEMDDMIDVVAAPLAASLARQARVMDDQHVAQDDLSTAVVEVIRQALSTGRAHVRDEKGVIGPAVPGEVEQVQGVAKMKDGSETWEGKGPAFYWLPDKGPAFGVRTIELHTLLKASSDTRVQGIGQRTLPDTLLKAGLTIRNDIQKARVAVHQIRVGDDNPRLLLIKAELVWDLPDPGPEGGNGGGGNNGDDQPSGTDPSTTAHQDQNTTTTLFDVIAEKNGITAGPNTVTAPVNSPAPNDDSTATDQSDANGDSSAEEDDDMTAITNNLPKGPCVRCGNITTAVNDAGQWQHQELPGLYRCDQGYTAPEYAHLTPVVAPHLTQQPAPAAPPAAPSIPAQANAPEPTPAPRPEVHPAATPEPTLSPRPTGASEAKTEQPTETKSPAAAQEYPNGPLAVLDVTDDGQVLAHLVDGRTLDCPARSIPTLVKWALNAGLGTKRLHKWGTDGDPMVILTAAATDRFGLPDTLDDVRHQRLPDNHKVVKAITKSGWELTKRGFSPWTRIYKPIDKEKGGERACVQIGIAPWDALGAKSGWHLDSDAPAADIARALGVYTQRVISPRGTMGSSGLELMLQLRPPTRPVWSEEEQRYVPGKIEEHLHRTVKAVPCEANENHPVVFEAFPNGQRPDEEFMREEAWSWHRDTTAEEAAAFAHVIGIDTNTSFLSSSSRLLVGGNADPVHHVRPAFNQKIPGAWKVDFSRAHLDIEVPDGKPNPLDPRLPSPFTNTGEPPAGPRWYTTQTCDYARKMGIKVEPIEAWLREPLPSGWLDPWNERLATAYKTTMANLGLGITEDMPMDDFLAAMARYAAGEGDPIERTVLKAIKQTVKSGIGKLAQTPNYIPGYRPGTEWSEMTKFWWRPDIRAAVIATARIVQHRKIVRTLALTGRAPLATYSDCVVYPAYTTNPLEVIRPNSEPIEIKGAFNFGVRPGYAKLEGIRSMDWFQELQADGINAAKKIAPREGERVDEGE